LRAVHDTAAAEAGRTGIARFDASVHELVTTGNLHNDTRMWFASNWNFTLLLPWQLGAAFHAIPDG
jgi:deoxyribodipyrimidine photolyase